jgi:hypothetical protein
VNEILERKAAIVDTAARDGHEKAAKLVLYGNTVRFLNPEAALGELKC